MTMMTPQPLDQQEDEEMLVPHSDLVEGPQPSIEGPQPMEVAPADNAGTVENQVSDEPQASCFTWTIESFSRLNMKKLYSDVFIVGGYKWQVLIFPKGNTVDYLSMYLDVADSATLPYGWNRYAQFSLAIVNHVHSKYTIKKETPSTHQFTQRENDWGFTSFMPLSELYDPNKGYLVNDTCVVEADVTVRKVIDHWTYDSKKETSYVGLKNQGATGYMNSLLQTLYHIPYFRKAVYHMPTTENDNPTRSILLALQSLFYKLQYNDTSVATKQLTKSFGWDTHDSFMQHDVQELNRVLCEKLEDKMKGTVVEGTIQKLFEGHHMNYIECINVDFKSTRKESFYDLQLDVKGCKDVYASFDKYVEVEHLEGDNKYDAEEHGLQDAKKGVLFIDFPPVLQLQLKRFEYDFMRDTMAKINDRYEFPLELDLDRDNGKYLLPEANRSVRNLYMLHSVLVHSGGVHGSHYYAFIRPTLSDQWYKFDDERVSKEDVKRALEEQYGGEEELPQTNPGYSNTPFKFTKYSNAYMLVYIRVSDKDKIICDVDEKDIAEHLRIRLKKEQVEKEDKRRYKAQAHLYTIIKVARDEDLREQIGKDIYFDLVDHDKVRNFRIQKQLPFHLFKEEVAKELGIPVQFQRFWIWAKRQNHTYRPNRPLTPQEEAQTVGALREVSNKAHNAELKLFLEVEHGPDLRHVPPPEKIKEDILLFFKLYDPAKEELRYVGRLFVKSSGKPIEILTKLNELAGFAPDEEIELFEEIKYEPSVMCKRLDKRASFRFSEIEDGDIICFQKRPLSENEEKIRFPDVPLFLEYVKTRQVVHFRALERPMEDEFFLELEKNHTYDDVVERVAHHLGLDDPSKIRLTPHNCYSQQPKPNPIKYRAVDHLLDMLVHYNQISDILYYEVLDIPVPELQCLKTLKVAFHHATKDEALILNIRLPKQSTVGDVLNEIKTKVELSHPSAELRLLEVFYHKIYKIFPVNEKIENINDQYWTLRAEEIPEEEKNLGPNDRLIHVYHFTKESAQNQVQVQNFGEPFFLVIHEGETLEDVKVRIQKRLQVPDEEFSKWKFAFLSLGRPEYLENSDIVSSRFQRRDVYGAWEQYLGLEHSDTTPKRAYTASQQQEDEEMLVPHSDLVEGPQPLIEGRQPMEVIEMGKLTFSERVSRRQAEFRAQRDAERQAAVEAAPEVAPAPPSVTETAFEPSDSPLRSRRKRPCTEVVNVDADFEEDNLLEAHLESVHEDLEETFGASSGSPSVDPSTLPPSVMHNRPPGVGVSMARTMCLDPDMEFLRSHTLSGVFDLSCNWGVQFLQGHQHLYHRAMAAEQQARLFGAKINLAEKQLSSYTVQVQELQSNLQGLTLELSNKDLQLQDLEQSLQEQVAEARRQGALDFQDSSEFQQRLDSHGKAAVKEYKSSTRGREWVEARAVEYLVQGFTRCQLQLGNSGLFPPGADEPFLDMAKSVPGEFQIPPYEDSGDEE